LTIHFSAYIATSLDGFIARSNGDLDWLFNATTSTDDHGYAEYMNGIDTIVMGRNTYQTVLGFGEWPYPEKRVVVLSTTLSADAIPSHLQDKLLLHTGACCRQLLKSLTEHGCEQCVCGWRQRDSIFSGGPAAGSDNRDHHPDSDRQRHSPCSAIPDMTFDLPTTRPPHLTVVLSKPPIRSATDRPGTAIARLPLRN